MWKDLCTCDESLGLAWNQREGKEALRFQPTLGSLLWCHKDGSQSLKPRRSILPKTNLSWTVMDVKSQNYDFIMTFYVLYEKYESFTI